MKKFHLSLALSVIMFRWVVIDRLTYAHERCVQTHNPLTPHTGTIHHPASIIQLAIVKNPGPAPRYVLR